MSRSRWKLRKFALASLLASIGSAHAGGFPAAGCWGPSGRSHPALLSSAIADDPRSGFSSLEKWQAWTEVQEEAAAARFRMHPKIGWLKQWQDFGDDFRKWTDAAHIPEEERSFLYAFLQREGLFDQIQKRQEAAAAKHVHVIVADMKFDTYHTVGLDFFATTQKELVSSGCLRTKISTAQHVNETNPAGDHVQSISVSGSQLMTAASAMICQARQAVAKDFKDANRAPPDRYTEAGWVQSHMGNPAATRNLILAGGSLVPASGRTLTSPRSSESGSNRAPAPQLGRQSAATMMAIDPIMAPESAHVCHAVVDIDDPTSLSGKRVELVE